MLVITIDWMGLTTWTMDHGAARKQLQTGLVIAKTAVEIGERNADKGLLCFQIIPSIP